MESCNDGKPKSPATDREKGYSLSHLSMVPWTSTAPNRDIVKARRHNTIDAIDRNQRILTVAHLNRKYYA